MARQQLPPQIKKRVSARTGTVRYEVILDAGKDASGNRRQVRRRYKTEQDAKDALREVQSAVHTNAFVPRKDVTVEQLCDDWLESLHNARATTIRGYAYVLAPLKEKHGHVVAQRLSRQQLDRLVLDLKEGGTKTVKGNLRGVWSSRSINLAINTWRLVFAYGVRTSRPPTQSRCRHEEGAARSS